MCMEIKEIAETGDKLQKTIESLAITMDNAKSISKIARYYAVLKQTKDSIDKLMDNIKPDLLDAQVNEYYPVDDLKVVYQEGAKMTKIKVKELFESLEAEGREEEFFQIATVTETALKTIKNGEMLIAENKVVLEEKKAPSIRVATLSKDDRKLLAEGAIRAN